MPTFINDEKKPSRKALTALHANDIIYDKTKDTFLKKLGKSA